MWLLGFLADPLVVLLGRPGLLHGVPLRVASVALLAAHLKSLTNQTRL